MKKKTHGKNKKQKNPSARGDALFGDIEDERVPNTHKPRGGCCALVSSLGAGQAEQDDAQTMCDITQTSRMLCATVHCSIELGRQAEQDDAHTMCDIAQTSRIWRARVDLGRQAEHRRSAYSVRYTLAKWRAHFKGLMIMLTSRSS